MDAISLIAALPLAAAEGGKAAKEESGSFLVSPNVGLMVWTLLAGNGKGIMDDHKRVVLRRQKRGENDVRVDKKEIKTSVKE